MSKAKKDKKDKKGKKKDKKKKKKKKGAELSSPANDQPAAPNNGQVESSLPLLPEGVKKMGPAARVRAEGKSYNIRLQNTAYTPMVDENGEQLRKIQPYLPVVGACMLCPARCCRLNVKVSLADAVHFCTTLAVPFFSGLTLVPGSHENHSFLVEREPRFVPQENGWPGRAEIQLKRTEEGACHAVVGVGGYERCGVYEARPSLCRLYPMTWESDVAKGGPEVVLCPVPYGVKPDEERKFLRDVSTSIERWELHDDVVEAWHDAEIDGPRTADAFLEFAIPMTAKAMGVEDYSIILSKDNHEDRLYQSMLKSKVVRPPAWQRNE